MQRFFNGIITILLMIFIFSVPVDAASITEDTNFDNVIADGSNGWASNATGLTFPISNTKLTIKFHNDAFVMDNETISNFIIETKSNPNYPGFTMCANTYAFTYGDNYINVPTWVIENSWGDDLTEFKKVTDDTNVTLVVSKLDANTVEYYFTFESNKDAWEKCTITFPDEVPTDLEFYVGTNGGIVTLISADFDGEYVDPNPHYPSIRPNTGKVYSGLITNDTIFEGQNIADTPEIWNSIGTGVTFPISEKDVTVVFTSDAFVRVSDNWANFVAETLLAGDAHGFTCRADAYGWTYGDGSVLTNVPTWTCETSWGVKRNGETLISDGDWTKFHELTDYAKITLKVSKITDDTIEFYFTFSTDSSAWEKYTITYPNGIPQDLSFQIGSDGGYVILESVKFTNPKQTEPEEESSSKKEDIKPPKDDKPSTPPITEDETPSAEIESESETEATTNNSPDFEIIIGIGIINKDEIDKIQDSAKVEGNNVPPDSHLIVSHIIINDLPDEVKDAITNIITDSNNKHKDKKYAILDLKLKNDNSVIVQPNGKIKINLAVPENLKHANNITIFRIEDDGKKVNLGIVKANNGRFSFETDHFTTYMFVEAEETDNDKEPDKSELNVNNEETTLQENSNDTTNNISSLIVWIIVIVILLLLGATITMLITRKRR